MITARVFCVGRNYADHAIEMGGDGREAPFFFMKPAAALFRGDQLPYPPDTADLHHEVELVLAIGRGGANIAVTDALAHVAGYGVGVDLTKRDRQAELKAKGQPWERAKAFDHSAPISAIHPVTDIGHPEASAIRLSVNGEIRQQGNTNQMICKTPEIIAELSRIWTLAEGDMIFTGTPAGVSAIVRGDKILAEVEGVARLAFSVA
jgi:fumarylpyruvate hydrolase